jgi:hypothetical protein
VKLRGESRHGVKTSLGISRLEAGRRGVAGGDAREWQLSANGGGGETNLTAQAHLTKRQKKSDQLGRREPKGKRTSVKTPPTHGLDGPTRVALARERRGAIGAGWAKGRVGRKVGRAESEEKEFLN